MLDVDAHRRVGRSRAVNAAPALASGDIVAGRYEVQSLAGEGGMAEVYSARHLHLAEHYAIKILRPELAADSGLVSRFLQEARAAAQLKSDHTCRVFDVGLLPQGIPYIVMELLHGEDLGGYLHRAGALPREDAVEFVVQACEALAEAHSVGLVHRDIKPENLFVTTRPDGWRSIKLLDFGISKLVDPESIASSVRRHVDTADLLGTPHYMAPEQIRSSRDAEARSDLWSLGVVLYELLSGRLPFEGTTVPEVSAAILESEPPSLGSLCVDLDPALVEVVHWCLAKQLELRVSSAAELAAQLVSFAPRRTRAVVERVQSIARSQGERIDLPASIAPPPMAALTMTTDPGPGTAPSRIWLWGIAAIVAFGAAAGVTWLQRGEPRSSPSTTTSTEISPAPTGAAPLDSPKVDPSLPAQPKAPSEVDSKPLAATPPPTRGYRPGPLAHSAPVEPPPTSAPAASVASPPAKPTWDKGPDLGF